MSSNTNTFVCPVHFTEDYYHYFTKEKLFKSAVCKYENGHYHVERWGENVVICTKSLCVERQNTYTKNVGKIVVDQKICYCSNNTT